MTSTEQLMAQTARYAAEAKAVMEQATQATRYAATAQAALKQAAHLANQAQAAIPRGFEVS
jgi:hypothetical protein